MSSRPAFLPPPPTVIRRSDGRPTFGTTPSVAPQAGVIATDPNRPTLRMPAVPAPAADVPTQPMMMQPASAAPAIDQPAQPAPVIDANEPTLEEKPVRVEDMSEDQDAHTPVARGRVLRARKKGAPAPRRATPVHRMPEIDPAAWLADEAHARTSDRRDSADGVDNSDTIVSAPRPTHYV